MDSDSGQTLNRDYKENLSNRKITRNNCFIVFILIIVGLLFQTLSLLIRGGGCVIEPGLPRRDGVKVVLYLILKLIGFQNCSRPCIEFRMRFIYQRYFNCFGVK